MSINRISLISFEELASVMLKSCGKLDTPLFVRAVANAGIDITNVMFDLHNSSIIIQNITPLQMAILKVELKKSQYESDKSVTGRVFCLDQEVNEIVIYTNKYKPHVIEQAKLGLDKLEASIQKLMIRSSQDNYTEVAKKARDMLTDIKLLKATSSAYEKKPIIQAKDEVEEYDDSAEPDEATVLRKKNRMQ